jgi:hypothetical protein
MPEEELGRVAQHRAVLVFIQESGDAITDGEQ